MVDDVLTRAWENLIRRPAGPFEIRFLLQPAVAIYLAIRDGLKDSREGNPPYFWSLLVNPHKRLDLLRHGWTSIGKVFVVALVIDCVYQMIELRWLYPFEALVVAFVLAIFPYLLVRGPVNRVASAHKATAHRPTPGRS